MGFMFFDLDKYLKNLYHWLRFRKTDNIKEWIGVKSIDKYIKTKTQIAIIQVFPINFGIKGKDEKDAITRQFLKFMNAIDFPIQILMKTMDVGIDDYIEQLEPPKDYKELFEKSTAYLKQHIIDKQIKDRAFYLVIPEKNSLNIQVQICKDWLRSLNLEYKQLEKKELQELVDIKGKQLVNAPSHLQIDDTYQRIIYAHGYPRLVEQGFLDKVVSATGDFDFTLHIEPYDVETMMININKQLQKQKADLYAMGMKGTINPSLEIQFSDTKKVLEELQKGNDKLFNISLYINCKAENLADLDLLTRKVMSTLNSLMIIPKVATFQMDRGYKSLLPLAENKLKISRNITSKGLSAFFPFTSPFFRSDEKGVWLGVNKNGIPIIKDIFELSNPNGVILAQSGGGKSYFAKLLISRYLLNGTRVMVIDPQGEYRNLVGQFKGERIDLSRTSENIINPLDLMGHDYAEKRLALMDLMNVMLGDLSEPQRAFIDKAITQAYLSCGITNDAETWENEPPILSDIMKALTNMEKKSTQMEKISLRSLINRLSLYVDGVFCFLNRQTNIDFSNNFVCFDIGDIPKPVKPTLMFLVLEYVYAKMKQDIGRKILLIDEAWSLLSRAKDASYIFEIVKTCRKFNMGLLLINQEVEGLLTSAAGKSVLANSAYTVLLKQKPAVISNIKKVFHLSNYERDYLLSASVGEGILIIENEHLELKVIASEAEHKVITTKADELIEYKKKEPKKVKKKVSITVDPKANYFINSKVSKEEKSFLLKQRFKEVTYTSIDGKKRKHLIKPRFNESDQHCLVTYDLYHHIKQFTDKTSLYITKKPDIVFSHKGKKFAIEVETGKINNKKILKEKITALRKEYGTNWCIVVTSRNYLKHYRKYGKTCTKQTIVKFLQKAHFDN